jgi:coenzyme F420-reducing hydrogenase beta subunit
MASFITGQVSGVIVSVNEERWLPISICIDNEMGLSEMSIGSAQQLIAALRAAIKKADD